MSNFLLELNKSKAALLFIEAGGETRYLVFRDLEAMGAAKITDCVLRLAPERDETLMADPSLVSRFNVGEMLHILQWNKDGHSHTVVTVPKP